ncbi:hydrogenase formation protein HypD [Blastopirellula sp. JC732]|uniref:Hydrogenase formation protein HypD n=1 Tax=Blastopirellula sediminis TaxID=2894196 RepID=A0A9X1MLL6_9BACT|nr:hydrogenase formation protein HypD [Blastopirellula sediminis]MCC9608339.1 hydrogenase formation protein HypD [Blastopirellula sediminis]MCC9628884.1 hydrogenase formation protein HypD [Blastopirellula sediminis]
MKYVDEFRDADACQQMVEAVRRQATRCWTVMEVCGGQTHGLLRWGIDQQLDGVVKLLHGPGCPVCVTATSFIDRAVALSKRPGVIVTSFGDMLRVPGSDESLLQARCGGGNVKLVYSPLDAVQLAREQPETEVVFFAVGFETTTPATALAVKQAAAWNLTNFSLLVAHVRVQPAMEMIAAEEPRLVDGFLAAGHVCAVAGYRSYESLVAQYQLPVVVTGFEPLDLLIGIRECVEQLERQAPALTNCYSRCVAEAGNPYAQNHVADVFEAVDREWRGLGVIEQGGLGLRPEWRHFDATQKFSVEPMVADQLPICPGGEIMTGRLKPVECPFFGRECTPETPLGAPMVSSEGACAAYYRYASPQRSVRSPI